MRPPCSSGFRQTGLWDGLHPSLVQSSVSLAPKQIWVGAVYADNLWESKRYPPLLPEELRRADVSGSVRGAEGVSEDPCERLGEHDGRGAVQGEKEVSLPGFLSCTIDSVETGGRMED